MRPILKWPRREGTGHWPRRESGAAGIIHRRPQLQITQSKRLGVDLPNPYTEDFPVAEKHRISLRPAVSTWSYKPGDGLERRRAKKVTPLVDRPTSGHAH